MAKNPVIQENLSFKPSLKQMEEEIDNFGLPDYFGENMNPKPSKIEGMAKKGILKNKTQNKNHFSGKGKLN